MPKLIDANALFDAMEDASWYNNADRDEVAEELVLNAAVIDAVPMVRCKECQGYQPTEGGKPLCVVHEIAVSANDYCSYGTKCDESYRKQVEDDYIEHFNIY